MGQYLLDHKALGEIAICDGTALLFQFDWRKTTLDVFGWLPSGHTKLVIRYVRTRAILLHWAGTARGRYELAIVGVPADACIRRKIWRRALSARRKA